MNAQKSTTLTRETKANEKKAYWQELFTQQSSTTKRMIGLIKYPVFTEKSYLNFFKQKQYTFHVDVRLTKTQIKNLFQRLFDVNVIAIQTNIPPQKKVRLGMAQGYKSKYKKAILTLKEGQAIRFFDEE